MSRFEKHRTFATQLPRTALETCAGDRLKARPASDWVLKVCSTLPVASKSATSFPALRPLAGVSFEATAAGDTWPNRRKNIG